MGFNMHFYIIIGTNLLTEGPVQIAIFCLFQCFAEMEYQMESKHHELFGEFFGLEGTQWARAAPGGVPRGGHNPPGLARRPKRALLGCVHLGCPPGRLFAL